MEIEKRLTSNYRGKENVGKLVSILEQEGSLLRQQAERLGDQFVVNRATEGLSDWERLVGVTPDESRPLQHRRRLVQELLAGVGTLTEDKLERMINLVDEDVSYEVDYNNFLITFKFPQSSLVDRNIYWTVNDFRVGYTPVQNENYPRVRLDFFGDTARKLIAAHIDINYDAKLNNDTIGIRDGLMAEVRVYQKAGEFEFNTPLSKDEDKVVFG